MIYSEPFANCKYITSNFVLIGPSKLLEHMFSSSRPSFFLPLFCPLNSPTPLVEVPRELILNLKLKETKRGEKSICHLSVVPRATSYTNFIRRKTEIERSQHQQIKRDLTKKKKVEKRESSSTFIF